MSTEIIAAATGADTGDFAVVDPTTFVVQGVQTASEDIDVQIWNGAAFVDLYQDGSQVVLNDTNVAVTAYGPGLYRINKGVTSNAIGIIATRRADMG